MCQSRQGTTSPASICSKVVDFLVADIASMLHTCGCADLVTSYNSHGLKFPSLVKNCSTKNLRVYQTPHSKELRKIVADFLLSLVFFFWNYFDFGTDLLSRL
jgi:hypothetical protein